MRVCLINPPLRFPASLGMPRIFPPLGLAYVAATLEGDFEVSLVDAPAQGWRNLHQIDGKIHLGMEYDQVAAEVKSISPDIVGITVPFSANIGSAFEVAHRIKSLSKDIITVLGGPHPSIKPLECLMNPDVDFVVIGEGEHTMLELVKGLGERNNRLKGIRGIAYVDEGKTIVTTSRSPISDLDSLPFPARSLLPMKEYFEAAKAKLTVQEAGKPWATLITSRGCPYCCVFCSIHVVMGKKWRPRSPENVVDEIEQLVNRFQVRQIDFEDDNMTLDRKRMANICDLIVQKGLDIEWFSRNGVRADTLDESLLRKMKESGCKTIWISPESGVQRIVDHVIKKRMSLKKVEEVVALCKKVGITIGCFFVIGLPGETKRDIEDTIRFARRMRRLGADHCDFNIATPYYGTELYEQAKQKGYLNDLDDESLGTLEPHIATPEFTRKDIYELRKRAKRATMPPLFSYDNLIRAIRNPGEAKDFIVKRLARTKETV